jgi:hypothetical protein
MQIKTIIALIFLILGMIFLAGCTQNSNVPSQISNPIPTELKESKIPTTVTTHEQQTSIPIPTETSTHATTCFSNTGIFTTEPRTPLIYEQGNPNPVYHRLPPPPIPMYNGKIMQNDPIIGTYIFDPSQFKSADVERLDYFSTLDSSEYFYVVPLDISPDIKWTFRDDGILLFYQNNITCSDDSLRRFWRNSSGDFLRNGTWKRLESGNDENKYQITWGCFGHLSHDYIVTYDKNGVHLTQPKFLSMTKID